MSTRSTQARRIGRVLGLLAAAGLFAGCAHGRWGHHRMGYTDERTSVQMVTAIVGGKNVYIPSTVVVTEGSGRKISVYNSTDTPHGFSIPGLGVEAVLPPRKETVIDLPPLKDHMLYQIQCQLHPAHRTATLMVVRGK